METREKEDKGWGRSQDTTATWVQGQRPLDTDTEANRRPEWMGPPDRF